MRKKRSQIKSMKYCPDISLIKSPVKGSSDGATALETHEPCTREIPLYFRSERYENLAGTTSTYRYKLLSPSSFVYLNIPWCTRGWPSAIMRGWFSRKPKLTEGFWALWNAFLTVLDLFSVLKCFVLGTSFTAIGLWPPKSIWIIN